ncbi:MAG: PD-(D/E)XK nuclease family protein [Thermodesulfobacteriota bacterium]
MSDLFSKIFRYLPSEKFPPLEIFLTEIFSYLLKKLCKFREKFFDLAGIEVIEFESINEDSIQTQFPSQGSRFDILISNDNLEIIIENKVDSAFGQDQLKKYREYLSAFDKKFTAILTITKSIEDKELDYADTSITWYELYEKLLDDRVINRKSK